MPMVIGVTGSLGSGKTTVSLMFAELGADVYSADKIAHQLIQRGNVCYQPLIDLLGQDILTGNDIDRKKVGLIVFKQKKSLKDIEAIIHPEVIKVILEKINFYKKERNQNCKVLVFDVPLLYEAKLDKFMDRCIVVKATQKDQILRSSLKLGITKKQALMRIKTQMPLREKVKRADIIIDNRNTKIDTRKQVKKIWQEILQTMKKK